MQNLPLDKGHFITGDWKMANNNRKLTRLPLTAVKPEGWLLKQLEIQMNGLTGKLHDVWESVGTYSGWLGGTGEFWERAPYYLDGLVPLAHYLQDQKRWDICMKFIEWTLASQTEDGNFGPVQSRQDYWSRFVMVKVLIQYAEIQPDERAIPFLKNYFRYLGKEMPQRPPVNNWSEARIPDLLYGIKWLYEQTGEQEWIELGRSLEQYSLGWDEFFHEFPFPKPMAYYYDWNRISTVSKQEERSWMKFHTTHIVNVMMGLKHSAMKSYFGIGEKDYGARAVEAVETLKKYHGVVSGAVNGDEHLNGNNPTQGAELCSIVEGMFSMETNLEVFGDPYFGDYLERLAFNALPATITEDFMAHQYLQQANQVLVSDAERNWFNNENDSNVYGLEPNFGCCTANMHQGWPKLVNALWFENETELISMILAPSSVSAKVNGEIFAVRLTTEYPFRDSLSYEILEAPEAETTLKIRVPGWCKKPELNGTAAEVKDGFIVITKKFAQGEKIAVRLPMETVMTNWYKDSTAVERGALVYGLELEENWTVLKERGGVKDYAVDTASDWNYALVKGGAAEAEEFGASEVPFGRQNPPCRIYVNARKVPKWKLEKNSAGEMPASPVQTDEAEERIALIPFGCTKLRISEFPYCE